MTARTVTIGRGRDTHRESTVVRGRTLCGKVWTDEHQPEARITCSVCRTIERKSEEPER